MACSFIIRINEMVSGELEVLSSKFIVPFLKTFEPVNY